MLDPLTGSAIGASHGALVGAPIPRSVAIGDEQSREDRAQQQISDDFAVFHDKVTAENRVRAQGPAVFWLSYVSGEYGVPVRHWTEAASSPSRAHVRKEADFAYYRRRAREEMKAGERASCEAARASHLQLSTQYAILAEMIRTELGRRPANEDEA